MRSTYRGKRLRTLSIAALCFAIVGGCESLRDQTYTQGKGENIFAIADYKGKIFQASTGAKRFKGQTSRADELVTIGDFDLINNLDAVELSFTEGLLAGQELRDLIFYARENHAYTFVYDFTDHYMILSKVAPIGDIPSQELTYAEKTDVEMYKVPVLGVPIGLYTVEAVEDERGKDTRKLNEYPREYLTEATHFRMDLRGIKYFDAPGKQDLFPTDFFNPEDEWFFTKTLVGRPIDSQAILGMTLQALKIKMARTNNSLIGVDLNIAVEQEVLDPTKTITVLEFPVEWTDFRLERSGQDAYLKETKLGDQEPTSRFWRDRAYALIDFNNTDRLDKAFTLDNKLEKLEIGNDYLSFNIYESVSGNTYKYSLAKVNEVKEGQKYFADDATLFHIFSQKRTVIDGGLFEQTPDIENIVFATRFFPGEENEIVYHLSENSPETPEFVEAVRTAIEAWDTAYQEANTGINIRFDEERVQLGDVRYNQIVLYGYEIDSRMASGGTLLGFGPSIQDTRSGETYSAAVHIYLRAYREGLISNIRSFIRNEIGLYDDKVVASFNKMAPPLGGSSALPMGGGQSSRIDKMEGIVSNLDYLNSATFAKADQRRAVISDKMTHSEGKAKMIDDYRQSMQTDALHPTTHTCEHGNVAANSMSWQKIRENCLGLNPTSLESYLADLSVAHQADPEVMNIAGEKDAILECAQRMMKDLLISTLIHEVGHNLGLGHNFAASSDGKNYAKEADGTTAYPSSSVMDYPDRDYDLYSKVGPYDVAAIAYLYGRTIQTADGGVLQIPDGLSAISAAQSEGMQVKTYRMCTDYEIDYYTNLPEFDPLCVKWDVGASPVEYVRWAIQKIHAGIIEAGYRYNQAVFFGSMGATSYFSHFRQIHDYYRYLMQKQAGLYFEKVSAGDFTEFQLNAAMNKTRDPELTKSYYQAVKEIFEFSREILKMPSRICTLEDGGVDPQIVDLYEFRDLRDRIFDKHNVTVQSCKEALPLAQAALEDIGSSQDLTGKTFSDRGIEVDGLELDLDPAAASRKLKQYDFGTAENGLIWNDTNPLYSAGMFDLKWSALRTLFWRVDEVMAVTQGAGVRNISFVDIPWFRDVLYEEGVSRVVDGLRGEDIDERLAGKNQRYGHYREYDYFYWAWLISLVDAVGDQRSKAYGHVLSMMPYQETSQSAFAKTLETEDDIWYVQLNNQYYLFDSNGSTSGKLIKILAQIGQLGGTLDAMYYIESNPTGEQAKIDLAGVTTAEQLMEKVVEYLGTYDLKLQPPQKKYLATVLPDPTTVDVVTLVTVLGEFLNHEIMISPILMQMLKKNDIDNLVSLNAIILDYLGAIYG